MSLSEAEDISTAAGAAIYSFPLLLQVFYDFWVLGISNAFFWRCSTSKILLPFFKQHVRPRHLDIGVGTGYYLAKTDLPADASITLCDLNKYSLTAAKNRLAKSKTQTLLHDIEKPLPVPSKFQSISLMYLLHCMPGPPERKATIFCHLRDRLEPDGVLFGSTILGKGVEHNFGGRLLMSIYNQKGIFGNSNDSAQTFLNALKTEFEDVDAKLEGCVLLFAARVPI